MFSQNGELQRIAELRVLLDDAAQPAHGLALDQRIEHDRSARLRCRAAAPPATVSSAASFLDSIRAEIRRWFVT